MSFTKFKMDSKTAAELRRQKILANAEARLRKIRRITLEEVEKESVEQSCKSSPILLKDFEENEKEREIKVHEKIDDYQINKCVNQAKTLTNGGFGNGSLDNSVSEQVVTHLNNNFNSGIDTEVDLQSIQNVSRMPTLAQRKRQVCYDSLIFMVLGILIRLLYCIGLSSIFLNNILGPFFMICLPKVIFYIKQTPEPPLMYSMILLLGVKESRIKVPFQILSCLRTIIQSLALYLFSFFITHCVLKELPL